MAMYDTEERINYKTEQDDYWIRFGNPKESSSHTGNQGGKYLFFCENRKTLLELCAYEIRNHGFKFAKVSTNARNKDYVCCLYWEDGSRKYELAGRYKKRKDIKYRYWKSNEDTRAGKYSKEYKDKKPALLLGSRDEKTMTGKGHARESVDINNVMNSPIPDDDVSLICGGSIWDWQGF